MVTKVAPPYKNLFLAYLEQKIIYKQRQILILFYHYIDYILFFPSETMIRRIHATG